MKTDHFVFFKFSGYRFYIVFHNHIFNENYYINKNLSFEYVLAANFIKNQKLKFFHIATKESKWTVLKTVKYKLREGVKKYFQQLFLLKCVRCYDIYQVRVSQGTGLP